MNKEEFVYLKTKHSDILKCYKSEQMNKPIYHPVESTTNGYVDWNDVEKIFTIDDFYKENINLKQALAKIKDKLLCYGETFDSDIHKQFQKECLEIINEVNIDETME